MSTVVYSIRSLPPLNWQMDLPRPFMRVSAARKTPGRTAPKNVLVLIGNDGVPLPTPTHPPSPQYTVVITSDDDSDADSPQIPPSVPQRSPSPSQSRPWQLYWIGTILPARSFLFSSSFRQNISSALAAQINPRTTQMLGCVFLFSS